MDGRELRATLRVSNLVDPGFPILGNKKVYLALYARDEHVAYAIPSNTDLQKLLHSPDAVEVGVRLDTIKPGKYRYKWAIETFISGWPSLNSTSKQIEVN
jgi:hypothetical protein